MNFESAENVQLHHPNVFIPAT